MKKRKLNEAEYNLSITDLNTTDGDILSQIVSMANQADNGGMGDVPATPIEDPYASDMGADVPMDSGIGGDDFGDVELAPEEPVDDEFPSVEEDPTIDDMGYGVPVTDEPSDDFMGDEDVEENNFNEEEPYTHPMLHQDSGNLLTEDEGKKGYSVMVKDKEYAHIDTENEYSDDEIINQFLKQYMEKTGKEFPYIDQIVVKRNGDVEEDVLLPKDGSENEFIPEAEENWIMEDDDEEMTEDQINEEIDSILWSAGMKGCSDKEEKGVKTKSLMEDGGSSDTFQNLSDEKVDALYKKYKAQGLSDDEIFDKIYSEDCNLDNEEEVDESENPEMNMEDCDAPNPAEMNLDEAKNDETKEEIMANLEEIRKSIENENISYGEIVYLQDHIKEIKELDDILLAQWAGIEEDEWNNLDEAKGQKMMFYVIDANGDLVEGGFETRADARNYIQYVYNGTLGYPKQDVTGWRIKSEPAAPKADDPDFGEEIEESAYSPKLKDPNRKAPTRANYQDVNVNAAGKDASLGFEYPAPTGGKITLSPKAGKIMETAKHLMSKANGEKKDKLLSRYTFKLMNEGVSFSDAKRILSKF